MGILADIINKKSLEIFNRKVTEKQPIVEDENITRYNRLWLDKIERETGFAVSDNEKRVDAILKKLNERDGHCPCGGMTNEFLCPCTMMREHGACKCGLFMNFKDVEPKDTKSAGRIKEN